MPERAKRFVLLAVLYIIDWNFSYYALAFLLLLLAYGIALNKRKKQFVLRLSSIW